MNREPAEPKTTAADAQIAQGWLTPEQVDSAYGRYGEGFKNGWSASLYNCIRGTNSLSTSELYDLIAELEHCASAIERLTRDAQRYQRLRQLNASPLHVYDCETDPEVSIFEDDLDAAIDALISLGAAAVQDNATTPVEQDVSASQMKEQP